MTRREPVIVVQIRATIPGREPIRIRGEAEVDGGAAGALDRLLPGLIDELRVQVTGEHQ